MCVNLQIQSQGSNSNPSILIAFDLITPGPFIFRIFVVFHLSDHESWTWLSWKLYLQICYFTFVSIWKLELIVGCFRSLDFGFPFLLPLEYHHIFSMSIMWGYQWLPWIDPVVMMGYVLILMNIRKFVLCLLNHWSSNSIDISRKHSTISLKYVFYYGNYVLYNSFWICIVVSCMSWFISFQTTFVLGCVSCSIHWSKSLNKNLSKNKPWLRSRYYHRDCPTTYLRYLYN